MDGLQLDEINENNRTHAIIRAKCIVAEFLASDEARRELSAKEFEMILLGVKELE